MSSKIFFRIFCGIALFCCNDNVFAMEDAKISSMEWRGYGKNAERFFRGEVKKCRKHDNCFASASSNECQSEWPTKFRNLWCPQKASLTTDILLSHPSNNFWNTLKNNPKTQQKLDKYLQAAIGLPGGEALYALKRAAIACAIASGANPDNRRVIIEHTFGKLQAVSVRSIEEIIIMDDYYLAEFALIKYNIDPKEGNSSLCEMPLLFYAKTKEMAELLIQHGADVFQKYEDRTVLSRAQVRDPNPDLIAFYKKLLK